MAWWQTLLLAVVVAGLAYGIPWLAASGWSSAFFARKAAHNREVLKELERSITDGTKEQD